MIRLLSLFLSILVFFVIATPSSAEILGESIFIEGRVPVSDLDIKLEKARHLWEHKLQNPSQYDLSHWPNLIKTKSTIGAAYSYVPPKIKVGIYIGDMDVFSSLSRDDKKAIIKEAQDFINISALGLLTVAGQDGKFKRNIGKTDFIYFVEPPIISNTDGEDVRMFLPNKYNLLGIAAYIEGEYIYSEPYFLNVKMKGPQIIKESGSKTIIEKN